MRICIVGTWQSEKATEVAGLAHDLGAAIAREGYVLVGGTGDGVSALVARSYTAAGGLRFTKFLPDQGVREEVGEPLGPPADEVVETGADYPRRNIAMLESSDAVIALRGGLGTLAEIIHAVKDVRIPVIVLDAGDLPVWIGHIPELLEKVRIASSPEEALAHLKQ